MMEPIALTGLHVIEDESEYVFVKGDEAVLDDESYDHCDLSPSLSCATDLSCVTEVTLKDFTMSMIDEGVAESSMVSLDGFPHLVESKQAGKCAKEQELIPTAGCWTLNSSNENSNVCRLSNKKRRKKVKMMKNAAAPAALSRKRIQVMCCS